MVQQQHKKSRWVGASFALFFSTTIPPVLLAQDVHSEATTRTALVGYASNIESFPHYRCRFQVTYGTAVSEADAMRCKGDIREVVEAVNVVDGDRELLELFGSRQPTKPTQAEEQRAKGGVVYVQQRGTVNEKVLRKGGSVGAFVIGVNTLTLSRIEDGRSGPEPPPITGPIYTFYGDRGVRGPDRMLLQPQFYTPTFLGTEGGKDQHVGVRYSSDKYGVSYTSWLDPEKGYLPAKFTQTANGKVIGKGAMLEVKEFRPGRWFPMRFVGYYPEGGGSGKWSFGEMKVLELDVEQHPTVTDFSTTFPANTVVHREGGRAFFKLKQDERLSVYDLDELFDKLEKVKDNPRMDTTIEHTGERGPWWPWAAGGAGAAFLLLGGGLWWRKRRAARAASP